MFEAWRADPARAAGRLLGHLVYGVAYGKKPEPPAPGTPGDPDFIDEVTQALSACLERFCSPAVLFDPLTKHAVTDAEQLLSVTPVDVKALDGDIDSIRARIQLLEKRGLDHMPEYSYLKSKVEELTQKWRTSCHAQGEATSMQPAPAPQRELSAISAMYR